MPDPTRPSISTRLPAAFPPPWGFAKGFLTGLVIEVPALALGVWVLARIGVGDRGIGFMHLLRLTTVFAGLAAVFTAAGIGRLAAHASIDKIGGRGHAIFVAARAHAAASAGLIMIAAIPHGHLPDHASGWIVFVIAGAIVGAGCGTVIGAVCGGAAPVGIAEVMALARTPGAALRQLLDPEDLLKIGAAVRHRTSQMFGGMFEPAQRPPENEPGGGGDQKQPPPEVETKPGELPKPE